MIMTNIFLGNGNDRVGPALAISVQTGGNEPTGSERASERLQEWREVEPHHCDGLFVYHD